MLAMYSLQEAGPNTDLAWLLFVVLGFFLLIVVIGWLVSRRNGEPVEVSNEAHVQNSEAKPADDLVKIEGVGPKVAKVLNEAGITTFEALAHTNAAMCRKC